MSKAAAQHRVEYLGIEFSDDLSERVSNGLTPPETGAVCASLPKLHPAIEAGMVDAQRNIATARLRAFEDECFLMGEIARRYDQVPAVSDLLYRVAEANGLVIAHGDGLIHMMMVAGMRGDA